jgi:hypothetical protein
MRSLGYARDASSLRPPGIEAGLFWKATVRRKTPRYDETHGIASKNRGDFGSVVLHSLGP